MTLSFGYGAIYTVITFLVLWSKFLSSSLVCFKSLEYQTIPSFPIMLLLQNVVFNIYLFIQFYFYYSFCPSFICFENNHVLVHHPHPLPLDILVISWLICSIFFLDCLFSLVHYLHCSFHCVNFWRFWTFWQGFSIPFHFLKKFKVNLKYEII